MKKIISIALALILILSLAATSLAAPIVKKVQPVKKDDVDKQIDFIFEHLSELSQEKEKETWQYTVTDLDHNGSLELISAICKDPENLTYAKIFEVSEDRDAFIECDMSVEEGEPFVDIISDSADTYYDKKTDTWYYMFSEDFAKSDTEHYAVKCSVSLKDGYVTPKAYAEEYCEIVNGKAVVTYQDLDGNILTPEEFNNAGKDEFKDFEKSGTSFSWFSMKEAQTLSVLSDSYKVFTGEKEANDHNTKQNAQIVKKDRKEKKTPFLMITKNPTNEAHWENETAYFIATAENATDAAWTFVSPYGYECSAQEFMYQFPYCNVTGGNTTTLTIQNVMTGMTGWGAYCTFKGNNQVARSSTAYLNVIARPVPTQPPQPIYNSTNGTYNAAGSDNFAVGIYIPIVGNTVYVSPSIVNYIGSPFDGCPCTVDYTGNVPTGNSGGSIYQVTVYGMAPAPDPTPIPDYTWQCNMCGQWNTEYDYNCTNCGNPRHWTGLIDDPVIDWGNIEKGENTGIFGDNGIIGD